MLNERAIMEVGGVVTDSSAGKKIIVSELDVAVLLDLSSYTNMRVSPANAHRLARHLHRLATRVEKRLDESMQLAKK